MGMRVHVLNVCAARHSASLGAFVFHGSRHELFATVVTFFVLGKFLFVVPHILSCWMCSEVLLVDFGFGFVTSSKAVHNVVWLLVRLYKFFRWSPG